MSVFSEESLKLRRELAYACRILAANGQNDTFYGHVTYREAGAKTFWMKPSALGLDELTPETLTRGDLEGNVVEGELPRHIEFPLHAEIFRARPDITCVVHTHPIYSIAFAATGQPLHAVSHEGAQFTLPDVPRFTRTSRSDHHSRAGRGSRQHDGWEPCLLPDQPRHCRRWRDDRPGGRLSHQCRASQPGSASCRCLWSVLS